MAAESRSKRYRKVLLEALEEHRKALYERPSAEPFAHGRMVGVCVGMDAALRAFDEVMKSSTEEDEDS